VEPRDAATVMLVRDAPPGERGAGLEVFMLRRNLSSVFVAGAYVFPGGAVDDADREPATLALVRGVDDVAASAQVGRPAGGLGFWVAAIRESFEEAGVLLARERDTGVAASRAVVDRLLPLRAEVAAGELAFAPAVAEAGLALDGAALRVFGHWITPSPAPRRYDTWFFVAAAPEGHAYRHDETETIASEWIVPAVALDRARRGELELIYPTYRSLEALSRFTSTAALFAAVDAAWSSPATALREVEGARAWQVPLPGDESGSDDRRADAIAHSTTARRRTGTG
jgi:8-oxo-dGTP pyrophosphatase MutT (NUDIX family)